MALGRPVHSAALRDLIIDSYPTPSNRKLEENVQNSSSFSKSNGSDALVKGQTGPHCELL